MKRVKLMKQVFDKDTIRNLVKNVDKKILGGLAIGGALGVSISFLFSGGSGGISLQTFEKLQKEIREHNQKLSDKVSDLQSTVEGAREVDEIFQAHTTDQLDSLKRNEKQIDEIKDKFFESLGLIEKALKNIDDEIEEAIQEVSMIEHLSEIFRSDFLKEIKKLTAQLKNFESFPLYPTHSQPQPPSRRPSVVQTNNKQITKVKQEILKEIQKLENKIKDSKCKEGTPVLVQTVDKGRKPSNLDIFKLESLVEELKTEVESLRDEIEENLMENISTVSQQSKKLEDGFAALKKEVDRTNKVQDLQSNTISSQQWLLKDIKKNTDKIGAVEAKLQIFIKEHEKNLKNQQAVKTSKPSGTGRKQTTSKPSGPEKTKTKTRTRSPKPAFESYVREVLGSVVDKVDENGRLLELNAVVSAKNGSLILSAIDKNNEELQEIQDNLKTAELRADERAVDLESLIIDVKDSCEETKTLLPVPNIEKVIINPDINPATEPTTHSGPLIEFEEHSNLSASGESSYTQTVEESSIEENSHSKIIGGHSYTKTIEGSSTF